MGRSRRSFKKGKAKVRVGLPKRKPNKLAAPPAVTIPGTTKRLEWTKKTVLENYQALGLVADPNAPSARRHSSMQLIDLADLDDRKDCEPDDVRSALGKKRKDGNTAPLQRLTKMQRVYISHLILKHGDNYEVMSRDMKLNKMQHTPSALRKLCLRFHAYEKLNDCNENQDEM